MTEAERVAVHGGGEHAVGRLPVEVVDRPGAGFAAGVAVGAVASPTYEVPVPVEYPAPRVPYPETYPVTY